MPTCINSNCFNLQLWIKCVNCFVVLEMQSKALTNFNSVKLIVEYDILNDADLYGESGH